MAKRRSSAEVALAKKVKRERYKRQAKKLRATNAFGDLFDAKSGADLRRNPDNWPSHVKARITRYSKELGPLLASETATKRYFRPDHLEKAIDASPQERALPGQKAALFIMDDPADNIEISFTRRHEIKVQRNGITEQKMFFDPDSFIADPVAELERVLDSAPGKFFKFVMGANESKNVYNRDSIVDELERYIERYDPTEKDIGSFMYGIKAYPGLRAARPLVKQSEKHAGQVRERQRERWRQKSAQQRELTAAEKKSIRMTGRAGRVK